MHRQSLGSPIPKLQINVGDSKEEAYASSGDSRRKSSSASPILLPVHDAADHEVAKLRRLSSSFSLPLSKSEHVIHIIPLITLLCVFVLYLFSHNPDAPDLAPFTRLNKSPNIIDKSDNGNRSEFKLFQTGGILSSSIHVDMQNISGELPARKFGPRYNRISADF